MAERDDDEQDDDSYEMPNPSATLIVQTDGENYELILAGGRGIIRRHELFGPFQANKKKGRDVLKLLWDVAYQTVQDDLLAEIVKDD
jgi:hypothetical protein